MPVFGTERALTESQITTDVNLRLDNQKEHIRTSLRERRIFSTEELELLSELCEKIEEMNVLTVYAMYTSGRTAKEIMGKTSLSNHRVHQLIKEFSKTVVF
ncbi:MAG: hypothetical protein ACRDBQ_18835 [Shewanella sp.]